LKSGWAAATATMIKVRVPTHHLQQQHSAH
jgi:hypothetical protein